MNDSAYDVLGLGEVRRALADAAETTRGRQLALSLEPSKDADVVRERLAQTSDARRVLDEGELVALHDLPDIDEAVARMAVEGRGLDVPLLIELARFAQVSERARGALRGLGDSAPTLAILREGLPPLDSVASRIDSVVDADAGEVRDRASDELLKLRRGLQRARRELGRVIDRTLGSRDVQKLLQEPLVTTRGGRSVLPVKAECKSQFPGIVHGASSSGATVFVEPMAAVAIGNEIAELTDREAQEVRRVLLELTARIRPERDALDEAARGLGELDRIQAKARLSEAQGAAEPRLSTDELDLVDARHPLLADPVPLSFSLTGGRRGLVFTGPNTGGKTVALKTAGLLCLMALCGLHVPADPTTTVPILASIFADIGDDQSLASNLSTFSAHLSKVIDMERKLERPALVILDEVGTGTDPAEGGALGTALVEHFLSQGALVLASTHHGLLKAYASTTEGVGAASFQFDPDSYAPTYRILDGAAGRSLAFEMAERLGLPKPVVDRARELQSVRERQVAELQDRLEAEEAALEKERRAVEAARREAASARARAEEEEREARRERARELSELRATLTAELGDTRKELEALLSEARDARRQHDTRVEELDARLTRRIEEVAKPLLERSKETAEPEEARDVALTPGARVMVADFGVEGELTRVVSDTEAEVIVHDKKLRLALSGLEPLPSPADSKARPPRPSTTSFETKSTPSELNVIGCTVDEALSRVDKFLDDAFLGDHREVRLIHGHGEGRLRTAIRSWLSSHPHVAGHKSESHGGVTIVELES